MKVRFSYKDFGGTLFLIVERYDEYRDEWYQEKGWAVDSSRKVYEEFADYLGFLTDMSESGSIELS